MIPERSLANVTIHNGGDLQPVPKSRYSCGSTKSTQGYIQHSTAIRRLRPGTVCSLSWSGSYHQRPSLCEHLPSVGSDYWTSSKLVKERGVCEIPGSIPSPAKLSKVSGAMTVDEQNHRTPGRREAFSEPRVPKGDKRRVVRGSVRGVLREVCEEVCEGGPEGGL